MYNTQQKIIFFIENELMKKILTTNKDNFLEKTIITILTECFDRDFTKNLVMCLLYSEGIYSRKNKIREKYIVVRNRKNNINNEYLTPEEYASINYLATNFHTFIFEELHKFMHFLIEIFKLSRKEDVDLDLKKSRSLVINTTQPSIFNCILDVCLQEEAYARCSFLSKKIKLVYKKDTEKLDLKKLLRIVVPNFMLCFYFEIN